jgi:hypothetical protein
MSPSRRKRKNEGSQAPGGIHIGDHATIGGDVFTGQKTVNTYNTGVDTDGLINLLEQLQSIIKNSSVGDSDKNLAGGKLTAAINEVKDSRAGMSAAKLKEVGSYIQETKTILDRVMDIGEIGKKALPMILKAAAMVGLRLL